MENKYFKDLNKCSRCGGCQAHCPLFYETSMESYVARGKVELLENLRSGKIIWNDRLVDIFSTCLLCGACTENCPNGVQADKMVMRARKELVADRGLPIIKKNIFHHLLKYNGRLNAMGKCLYLYQQTGLQTFLRSSRLLNLMPMDFAKIETLLPTVASGPFHKKVPFRNAVEKHRLKVAYFTGCITNLINHNVGYSILKIMKAYGVEVIIPEQSCCGIPAFASGDFATGKILGEKNIKEFNREDVDYIIFDCATCLTTWLDYPELMESEEAGKLAGKLMDVNRFLVEVLDIKLAPREMGVKVTYHDPCHLKRTKNGRTAPRELLKRLSPAYEFVEMGLADRCCGSAGSFNISHYRLSQKVAARKVESIQASGANVVASACPSCMMQLAHALKNETSDVTVKHLVELVVDCLTGSHT
ncbi:MAG: (Fe-S)-binding protein [Desulfitobacterium hafniense]|nr:(Fe-S)-binding protein [Desulfitobacterium hafniense]